MMRRPTSIYDSYPQVKLNNLTYKVQVPVEGMCFRSTSPVRAVYSAEVPSTSRLITSRLVALEHRFVWRAEESHGGPPKPPCFQKKKEFTVLEGLTGEFPAGSMTLVGQADAVTC